MATHDSWQSYGWVGKLLGALLGLLAAGTIVYFIAVKARLLQSPAGGFWVV
jgi:hypothetical protein